MTADRLRAASALLRERAEAAGNVRAYPPPWIVESETKHGGMDDWTIFHVRAEGGEGDLVDNVDEHVAAYIATMSPDVGLALADWLSWKADVCDSRPEPTRSRILGSPDTSRALAVADAILGGAR